MSDEKELKSCPFCGVPPLEKSLDEIICVNDDCGVQPKSFTRSCWNTRSHPTPNKLVEDEFQELAGYLDRMMVRKLKPGDMAKRLMNIGYARSTFALSASGLNKEEPCTCQHWIDGQITGECKRHVGKVFPKLSAKLGWEEEFNNEIGALYNSKGNSLMNKKVKDFIRSHLEPKPRSEDGVRVPSVEKLSDFILDFYETECINDAMDIPKLATAIVKFLGERKLENEIVICSAIKMKDGYIGRGHRHER